MVAYNFKTAFHRQLIAGTKRQTVRHSGGKRHARPGDLVQIYTGMRTKAAHKLIPDVVCTRTDHIVIDVDPRSHDGIAGISINGIPLKYEEMQAFAMADGFDSLEIFGRFWSLTHGAGRFDGVVIHFGAIHDPRGGQAVMVELRQQRHDAARPERSLAYAAQRAKLVERLRWIPARSSRRRELERQLADLTRAELQREVHDVAPAVPEHGSDDLLFWWQR